MSILINKDTKVICQGFTGKQGRAMTDCPADSRSVASARTWMSGLVRSATDGSDNVSQCGCHDNYELIL